MARVKKKRKKLNGGRLLLTAVIILLLIVCALSLKKIITLHGEQADLKAKNKALTEQKASLEEELKNVSDLDYIEEQARKQLKMVKPGEVLYVTGEKGQQQLDNASPIQGRDNSDEETSGDAASEAAGGAGTGETGADTGGQEQG